MSDSVRTVAALGRLRMAGFGFSCFLALAFDTEDFLTGFGGDASMDSVSESKSRSNIPTDFFFVGIKSELFSKKTSTTSLRLQIRKTCSKSAGTLCFWNSICIHSSFVRLKGSSAAKPRGFSRIPTCTTLLSGMEKARMFEYKISTGSTTLSSSSSKQTCTVIISEPKFTHLSLIFKPSRLNDSASNDCTLAMLPCAVLK